MDAEIPVKETTSVDEGSNSSFVWGAADILGYNEVH